MKRKSFVVLVLLLSLVISCSSKEKPEKPKGCPENQPDSIEGLEVKGTRSERNVIKNMWPFVCMAQDLYQERRRENPKLKGTLILKMTVEFNGEIGPHSIVRSTLEDASFEDQILTRINFLDFDVYGPHNSESEIVFPIDFNP